MEVKVDGKAEISKPVKVEQRKKLVSQPAETSQFAQSESSMKSSRTLPYIEKDDEIGRGSFGVVYKGIWAGTDVAIKDIKVRNAKRLKCVMETEVQVAMARHSNISQIMPVSIQKNHIYIISEFIDGTCQSRRPVIWGKTTNLLCIISTRSKTH